MDMTVLIHTHGLRGHRLPVDMLMHACLHPQSSASEAARNPGRQVQAVLQYKIATICNHPHRQHDGTKVGQPGQCCQLLRKDDRRGALDRGGQWTGRADT
eukprot:1160676-Pelagomonas_calceolata.AAC.5